MVNAADAARAPGTRGLLPTRYALHLFGRKRLRKLVEEEGLLVGERVPASLDQVAFWRMCIRNIVQTGDESHGISRQPVTTWSTICGAVNQMDNVEAGVSKFAEITAIAPIGMKVSIGRSRRGLTLTFAFEHAPSTKKEIYCELIAMVFHCSLVWMADHEFSPVAVRLSALLRAEDGCFLDSLSYPSKRHGAGVTLTYARKDLSLPLGMRKYQRWNAHEPQIFESLLRRQASEVPGSTSAEGDEIVRVRQHLTSGSSSEAQTARALGVSPATLRRRLAASGTSFRSLSREARAARLRTMLLSDMPFNDIAAALEFSDRRSMTRACRQWLAMTPSDYRSAWTAQAVNAPRRERKCSP